MKKKYKIKKSRIFVFLIILIIFISIILFLIFKEKSYSISYNIADYSIDENYDKKNKIYYYEIKYDDKRYNFVTSNKYQKKRKLIKDVNKISDNQYICLKVESDYFNTNPLCYYKNKPIDYRLVSKKILKKLKVSNYKSQLNIDNTYNHFNIFNLKEDILAWNYSNFIYFNKDKITKINLFNKDIYDISLAQVINNYLFIPDYEQEYNFNKAYVIDLKNFNKKEWKLDYDISFDSYILGTKDDSIFIVDQKNQIEYELVPYKRKMRIVGSSSKKGIIYNEGKLEKITLNSLSSKKQSFTFKKIYNFDIKDNKLYLKYFDNKELIQLSNKEVNKIIKIIDDTVYYLVDDTLYFYSPKYGETKVITYSEWKYNYNNMIFINN